MTELSKIGGLQSPDSQPDEVMRAAGFTVILASAATALLPAGNFGNGPAIIGSLMILVGLLEMLANALRKRGRWGAMAAGAVSIAAGLLIFLQPVSSFVTTVYVVVGWLVARGLLLTLSTVEATGTKRATLIVATMDLVLAAIVWIGLTASALVIALFGPTTPVIADFAWLVAISFVGAGLLLVKIANDQSSV